MRREDREAFPHKNVLLAVLESLFLHGSLCTSLGNMLFLWIFGNNIEDRIGYVGYALFYLPPASSRPRLHVARRSRLDPPLIGASGAIAGVMGAYFVWFPRARVLTWIPCCFVVVYLPAWLVLGLWFALQFSTSPNEGVAWQAHVGGFVFGALIALAVRQLCGPAPPRRRTGRRSAVRCPGRGGPDARTGSAAATPAD